MNKWIAEFDLEDGDTMPEHMDLEYKGAKIDFHCKPLEQEPILDKIRAEIEKTVSRYTISRERDAMGRVEWSDRLIKESEVLQIIDKYKAESEGQGWHHMKLRQN